MKVKRNLTSHPLKPFPASNPLRRPLHKERLHAEKVAAELNRKHPEPMSLMHKREKMLLPAVKNVATLGEIAKAAHAYAAWDNSNPFAYGQTALYIRQGFLLSDEVVKETTQRTLARQAAKRKEVDDAKALV